MKKFLAVLLAVAMLVAGNVTALAADYTGPTVAIPDKYRYLTMKPGETLTIELEVKIPDKEYHVEWSSSNEDVATVDQNGKVTALAPGRVTITALNDGYGPWSEITVYDDEISVFLSRKNPGEVSRYAWTINCDDSYWADFILEKQGPDEIASVTSKNKNKVRLREVKADSSDPNEQRYSLYYQLSDLEFGLGDLDKEISDSIIVTLKSGKTHEFPLIWALTAYPYLSAHPTYPDKIVLYPEKSTTIYYELIDKQKWVTSYEPEVSPADNDVILGDIVKDGNKFSVTATCTNEYFHTLLSSHVNLQVKSEYNRYTGYYTSFLYRLDDVMSEYFASKPDKPSKPTTPDNPGTDTDATESRTSSRTEQKDDNTRAEEAAMDAIEAGKAQTFTTAAGASVPAVPVKFYGLAASLSVDAMETLSTGKTGLKINLDNGAAELLIPAGFQMPTGTGVLAYSLGHQADPLYANLMKAAVKEDSAKTEVHKLGGGTLPTTATITIKTKLTGKVNVYRWNEDTRKTALVASSTADKGKVTFAAKELGNFILTTGTI